MKVHTDRQTLTIVGKELLETLVPEERLGRLDLALTQRLSGLTVLLEDMHHTHNMGACVRTVEAFGLTDVFVIDRADAPFRPTHKVTRGGQKWVDTHRFRDVDLAVDALKARGFKVLATSPSAEQRIDEVDFSQPSCLCFGNELKGVSERVAARADGTYRLPMWGLTQSYNVSVALGISLWVATTARRRALGKDGDLSPEALEELRGRFLARSVRTSRRMAAALSATARRGPPTDSAKAPDPTSG